MHTGRRLTITTGILDTSAFFLFPMLCHLSVAFISHVRFGLHIRRPTTSFVAMPGCIHRVRERIGLTASNLGGFVFAQVSLQRSLMSFMVGCKNLEKVITTEILFLLAYLHYFYNLSVYLFLDWTPAGLRMGDKRRTYTASYWLQHRVMSSWLFYWSLS